MIDYCPLRLRAKIRPALSHFVRDLVTARRKAIDAHSWISFLSLTWNSSYLVYTQNLDTCQDTLGMKLRGKFFTAVVNRRTPQPSDKVM